jgi:hypothetical protein
MSFSFDLTSYAEVCAPTDAIYERFGEGLNARRCAP